MRRKNLLLPSFGAVLAVAILTTVGVTKAATVMSPTNLQSAPTNLMKMTGHEATTSPGIALGAKIDAAAGSFTRFRSAKPTGSGPITLAPERWATGIVVSTPHPSVLTIKKTLAMGINESDIGMVTGIRTGIRQYASALGVNGHITSWTNGPSATPSIAVNNPPAGHFIS